MSNVALRAMSITLGVFFVFFGCIKLCPILSEELYRDMSNRVFPLKSLTKWSPNAHDFRRFYGSMECVCGILLAFSTRKIQDFCNFCLLGLMIYDLHAAYMLEDGIKEASHGMVFTLLLICRLIIRLQTFKRSDNKTAQELLKRQLDLKHSLTCKYNDLLKKQRENMTQSAHK